MKNKHIQNNRNENNDSKNENKNTRKNNIYKNECEKNIEKTDSHERAESHEHEHTEIHVHQHVESQANKDVDAPGHTHTHTHVDENGNVYTHTHTHSPKIVKNELNRIARIIGHMKSIKIMIESGRDCSEVLIQLAAVDAAVKSLSRVILKEHMSTCIVDAIKTGDEEAIEALNDAIDKFMK